MSRWGMRVRVRLFAVLREAAGLSDLDLEMPDGSTPQDVWLRLAQDHPELSGRRRSLTAAVNRRYASFDAPLVAGDEVVFLPPVSGG